MPKFILFKEGHNGQMYWVSEWEKIFANPKEKAMAPHSGTLAWKIPWM